MFFRFYKLILLFLLILALALPNFFLLAEENLEEVCRIDNIEKKEKELSNKDYESFLRKCEAYFVEKSQKVKT